MKEIDEVIEKRGDWPRAFTAAEPKVPAVNV
jgi:hypothetical protein